MFELYVSAGARSTAPNLLSPCDGIHAVLFHVWTFLLPMPQSVTSLITTAKPLILLHISEYQGVQAVLFHHPGWMEYTVTQCHCKGINKTPSTGVGSIIRYHLLATGLILGHGHSSLPSRSCSTRASNHKAQWDHPAPSLLFVKVQTAEDRKLSIRQNAVGCSKRAKNAVDARDGNFANSRSKVGLR
jgi:hypothetical protein